VLALCRRRGAWVSRGKPQHSGGGRQTEEHRVAEQEARTIMYTQPEGQRTGHEHGQADRRDCAHGRASIASE